MLSLRRHIPNFITALNLCCGTLGVVYSLSGRVDIAFALMLLAAVFDFCDGLVARLLNAPSEVGRELDSIADEVSFGVLPAVMLYGTMRSCTFSGSQLCMIALLPAVFAGVRLAHFNVDESQKDSFKGLAAPVAALLAGSLCYYCAVESTSIVALLCAEPWFIPCVAVLLSALMVCPLRCFSMKFHKGDPKSLQIKRISFVVEIVLILAAVLFVRTDVSLAVLLSCILYILKNIAYAIFKL